MKPDSSPVVDRGEPTGLMEPVVLAEDCGARTALGELAFELAQKSAGFRRSLPASIAASLADIVRSMNCYYSNLIEGHDTHPIDIERALRNDYSDNPKQRDLQLEAAAHIAVQQWIDAGGLTERETSIAAVREVHRRFCEALPEDLKWAEDPLTKERVRVVPGEFRTRDVRVGQLVPVSPGAVPRFLGRFQEVFSRLGAADTVLASAAAHHRLAWIHPFIDGNGRVVRLMSHAMLARTLDTGALWSVARGLARNVDSYKRHLADCDQRRRNDLDGRGTLSQEALVAFTDFFLRVCLDQVSFMESLVQPDRLRARILQWAGEEARVGEIAPTAGVVLEALLYRGELPRAELPGLLGVGERQARRVVADLAAKGILASASSRSPIRLAFPATLASGLLPGLFPDKLN